MPATAREGPGRRPSVTPWGGALAAALLALAAAGCDRGADAAAPDAGGPPPPRVEAIRVEAETLRDVATFSGQVLAENDVMLRPEIEGVVESIEFTEGERVHGGDVLVRLRNAEQRARVAEAQANLALARENFDRAKNLVSRDAVSLAQRDRATAELAVADARLDLARLELERTEIRAPFDGMVGIRHVSPGDRVDDETDLVQIDAVDRVQVIFTMSDEAVPLARQGLRVDVRVRPYPNELFHGTVFFVSPTLDPATRRVFLKAWVDNEDYRLKPGLFANVDLEVGRREGAIIVPESAIVFDREGTYVWRLDDRDVPERVPVEVGLRKEGRVEITLGLRAGDRIVTAGTHKVKEGREVAVVLPPGGQALRVSPGTEAAGEGT